MPLKRRPASKTRIENEGPGPLARLCRRAEAWLVMLGLLWLALSMI